MCGTVDFLRMVFDKSVSFYDKVPGEIASQVVFSKRFTGKSPVSLIRAY